MVSDCPGPCARTDPVGVGGRPSWWKAQPVEGHSGPDSDPVGQH